MNQKWFVPFLIEEYCKIFGEPEEGQKFLLARPIAKLLLASLIGK